MNLLPAWKERLERCPEATASMTRGPSLPKSPHFYRERIGFVDSLQKAEDLLQLAQERPLSHVGFDTEFRYDRPGVPVRKKLVCDPRRCRPLLLSLALVEPIDREASRIYRFVIDLRVDEVRNAVGSVLRLPVCFVGHY